MTLPLDIQLAPGTHKGDLVLRPGQILRGSNPVGCSVLSGRLFLTSGCRVQGVVVQADKDEAAVTVQNGSCDVVLEDCELRGLVGIRNVPVDTRSDNLATNMRVQCVPDTHHQAWVRDSPWARVPGSMILRLQQHHQQVSVSTWPCGVGKSGEAHEAVLMYATVAIGEVYFRPMGSLWSLTMDLHNGETLSLCHADLPHATSGGWARLRVTLDVERGEMWGDVLEPTGATLLHAIPPTRIATPGTWTALVSVRGDEVLVDDDMTLSLDRVMPLTGLALRRTRIAAKYAVAVARGTMCTITDSDMEGTVHLLDCTDVLVADNRLCGVEMMGSTSRTCLRRNRLQWKGVVVDGMTSQVAIEDNQFLEMNIAVAIESTRDMAHRHDGLLVARNTFRSTVASFAARVRDGPCTNLVSADNDFDGTVCDGISLVGTDLHGCNMVQANPWGDNSVEQRGPGSLTVLLKRPRAEFVVETVTANELHLVHVHGGRTTIRSEHRGVRIVFVDGSTTFEAMYQDMRRDRLRPLIVRELETMRTASSPSSSRARLKRLQAEWDEASVAL